MKTEIFDYKKAVRTAWKNATQFKKNPSPLIRAVRRALSNAPFDPQSFRAEHAMGRFARRIAESDTHSNFPALGYHDKWVGEWEVTNSDLDIFGTFTMWLHRFCDGQNVEPSLLYGKIANALKMKRLQQALDRYRKSGLTRAHLALIEKAGWEVDTSRGDWISIFVQGKRPFGNSGVCGDIYELVGWKMPWGDNGPTQKQVERAWNLFDELIFALPDAARLAAKGLESK